MNNNFDYKKSLGQNFLIDNNIINKIVNEIDADSEDLIIEIGPGSGALTKHLSLMNVKSFSFEIDSRLCSELSKYENENHHTIYEDFLSINLNDFLKDKKYNKLFFIGNLPYYITTPIINKITDETEPYKIIIMVQKEVGYRFSASPCSKEYSSITVHLQYNYSISKVCNVNAESFYPRPKVDSVVISLTRRDKEKVNDINLFNNLVRDSFKLKRKNLRNNLKNYDLFKIEKSLKSKNKDLTFRAEELSVKDFIDIANDLSNSL